MIKEAGQREKSTRTETELKWKRERKRKRKERIKEERKLWGCNLIPVY